MQKSSNHKERWLISFVLILAIVLLASKYTGMILSSFFEGENEFIQKLIVPLGISYLCFKLIAFVIDVYRGIITELRLGEFYTFILFFPTFPAGPIERYQNFAGNAQNILTWTFILTV